MLNDIAFWSNDDAVTQGVKDAKYAFKDVEPYAVRHGSLGYDDKYTIVSEEFRPKLRYALDYDIDGNVLYMSDKERITWFNFVDWMGGKIELPEVDLLAVQEINDGLVAIVTNQTRTADKCKSESYVDILANKLFGA